MSSQGSCFIASLFLGKAQDLARIQAYMLSYPLNNLIKLIFQSIITMNGCSLAERKLRETIEAELKEDLSERKALIRQEVRMPLLH